jgi:O-antigen/teichoic acid export membrane protein
MRLLSSHGVGRLARRAGWNVVDQVLSALSNVLLAILVARTVDAEGFGAFSTAFLVFSLVVALSRAVIGQPLQISFAAADPADFHRAARYALGAAALGGLCAGALAIVAGILMHNEPGRALIALGVCLPGLLVQDICRMAFFSLGRPSRAAAIDGIWAVLEFGLLAISLLAGVSDVRVPIAIWGASATVAGIAGLHMLRVLPQLSGAPSWVLKQRRLTGYLLAEYVLGQGLAQVGILLVAVVGTSAGVGALRAAQVLLGPLGILGAAAFMFAVPEIAGRPTMTSRSRLRYTAALSTALGIGSGLYCVALLVIPDDLGRRLLGDTWTGASSVLLPMCILSVSAALATGPAATLYGMGHAKITFSVNVIKAPLLVVLMFIGIRWDGAAGAAWAIAATETVLLPLWYLRTRRILVHQPLPAPSGSDMPSASAGPASTPGGVSTTDRTLP